MRGAIAAGLAISGTVLVLAGAQTLADDDSGAPERAAVPHPKKRDTETVTRLHGQPVADEAAGMPKVLSVPRLGIEARVLRIRVEDGVLTPPSNPQTVGWDVATAVTGSAYGSSVITGHTVHTGGGALDELDDLVLGDNVIITTDKGLINYKVVRVAKRTKAQMVERIPELFRADNPGRVVLITCTNWNGYEYLANTIVIARPA